jgi:DNA-binding XRE family transcriptional regulator
MALDAKSKAAVGMGSLRQRLAKANPRFAEAAVEEARMEEFCAKVRTDLQSCRQNRKLHQEDVAAQLNLTQSAISKIETGRGDLGLRTLYRYARALGLRPVVTFEKAESAIRAAAARS